LAQATWAKAQLLPPGSTKPPSQRPPLLAGMGCSSSSPAEVPQQYAQPVHAFPQATCLEPSKFSHMQPPALQQAAYAQAALAPPAYGQHACAQPPYGQPGYGQMAHPQPAYSQPAYGQALYEQPAYGQPAYAQPAYEQPAYGQTAYGQPGYQQPAYGQPVPRQPQAQPAQAGGMGTGVEVALAVLEVLLEVLSAA